MNKPQTPATLCEAIRTAQILTDDMAQVEAYCDKADSVTRAAKVLIKKGLLSGWQANQLLGGATALRLGNVVLVDELTPWEAGRTFVGRDPKGRLLRIKLIPGKLDESIWEKVKNNAGKCDYRVSGCEVFRGAHQVGDRQVLLSQTHPGFDVKTYADQNELTLPQATQILQKIGKALEQLHEKNAHHGLLMSEKVHIDNDLEVRLLDVEVAAILPFLDVQGPSPHAESRRGQALKAKEDLGAKRADWSMLGQLGMDLIESIQDSDEKKRIVQVCQKLIDTGESNAEQWSIQVSKTTPDMANFSLNLDSERKPATAEATSPTESASSANSNSSANSDSAAASAGKEKVAAAKAKSAKSKAKKEKTDAKSKSTKTKAKPNEASTESGDGQTAKSAPSDQTEPVAEEEKKKTRRKEKAPAPAPPARSTANENPKPSDAADSADLPESTGKQSRTPIYVVAAIVGLAAVGGAIYGATQWLGGTEKETAQTDGKDQDKEDEEEEDSAVDPETDPTFDPETDPVVDGESDDGESDDTAVGDEASQGAEGDTATGDKGDAAGGTPDTSTDPADPKTDPKVEPTDPKVEPKVEPPPKPVRPPFAQLPPSIALVSPKEAQSGTQSFGKIVVDDPNSLFASLRGGGSSIRGQERFVMQGAENGTAVGKWEFNHVDRTNAGTSIATLELQGKDLVFQWHPIALETRGAGQLHNCAISFSSGKFAHVISLREALEIEPPKINLDRGVASVDWEVPLPPDPDAVYIEIAGVSGPFPSQKIVPEQPLNVSSQGQWIIVGTPQKPVMSILTQWEIKRGLDLEISTHFYPQGGRPDFRQRSKTKLNSKTMQTLIRASRNDMNTAQAKLATYTTAVRNQVPVQQRLAFDEEKRRWQTAYNQLQTTAVGLQELVALAPQIHDKSGLEFRVYHNADQTQVDLVRTTGFDAIKKKNAK
jgi:hypothetical protein